MRYQRRAGLQLDPILILFIVAVVVLIMAIGRAPAHAGWPGLMLLPWALAVGAARVILRVHFPGDVLAGAIVGLLAQGLTPYNAALCGAYLHALAGELWRQTHGAAGMLASDLLPLLPEARQRLRY